MDVTTATAYFNELNTRHALFLEPDTDRVLMANPFSAIATDYHVHANGRCYFANCAWDMLGIPVAIGADAVIETVCVQSGAPLRLAVRDGVVTGDDCMIHFLVPFRYWYDDLVFT